MESRGVLEEKMNCRRRQLGKHIRNGIVILVVLALSSQADAGTLLSFANGGFEGFTGNTNSFNSQVPPGWTTTGGTPDTFNANTTMAGFTWVPSSTGGDFLHGIGRQPSWNESAVQEALSGLTVGEQYEISFEQSISNCNYAYTGGYWEITFGTETHSSTPMALPLAGVASGWDWQTMIFTATAETQSLYVKAMSDTAPEVRTDIGIDSFYLGTPGENPDNPDTQVGDSLPAVPAPGAFVLVGLGTGLVGYMRRRGSL